jgi:hypothetical protein
MVKSMACENVMGNANEVRQLIQARIRAGQLPQARNYEIFGRKGDQLRCACCDDPITRDQIEYDVEFCAEMGAVTTLPMHKSCYRAWYEVSYAIQCGEHGAPDNSKKSAT